MRIVKRLSFVAAAVVSLILLTKSTFATEGTLAVVPVTDPEAQYQRGFQALSQEKFESATKWLKKAAAQGHFEALNTLITEGYENEDEDLLKEVLSKFSVWLVEYPELHAVCFYYLAQVVEDGLEFRELLEKAANMGDPEAQVQLGELLLEEGDFEGAKRMWLTAADRSIVDEVDALGLLVEHLFARGEFEEYKKLGGRFKKNFSEDPFLYGEYSFKLAIFYERKEMLPEAIQCYKNAEKEYKKTHERRQGKVDSIRKNLNTIEEKLKVYGPSMSPKSKKKSQ